MTKYKKNKYLTVSSVAKIKGFGHSSNVLHHLQKKGAPKPVAWYDYNGEDAPLYDPAQIAAWNPRGNNAKV